MTIGGIVKSMNECSTLVFVTIEDEDHNEIRLTLRRDDPRLELFAFRAQMVVEINNVSAAPARLAIR